MAEQFTGYVKVRDGNKAPQDYGVNREVEVSISFVVEDENKLEATAKKAATVADDIVNEKLNRTAGEPAKAPTKRGGAKPEKPPVDPASIVQTPASSPAAVAADPAAIVETKPASGQAISTGGERNDPAAMGGAAEDASLFTSAVEEINDNHLMSAITRTNAATKNSGAIRALIGKYVPQDGKPHQAAEIEKDKRQAFLLELDKVTKAA